MKKIVFTGLCTTLFFAGCFEDKSNKEYKDVRAVKIELPTTPVIMTVVDEYSVTPVLTFDDRSTVADFTYVWRENTDTIQMSASPDLIYRPKKVGGVTLELYAVDSYGYTSRAQMSVTVNTVYKFGFAILAEKEGRSAVHFVNRNNSTGAYTGFYDAYAALYPGNPLGTGPHGLGYSGALTDELIIFQSDRDVSIDGSSLAKTVYLDEEFGGESYPAGVDIIAQISAIGLDILLGDNGKIYTRVNQNGNALHTTRFLSMPQYFDDPDTYISKLLEVNPYTNSAWMFDSGNNRLLALSSEAFPSASNFAYIGTPIELNETGAPANFTSVNGMGRYQLINAADYHPIATEQNKAYFRNILKNPDGRYEVQSFYAAKTSAGATTMNVRDCDQQIFAGDGLVDANSSYALRSDGKYMFFSSGSKLYSVEFRTEQGAIVQYLELVHDFGKPIRFIHKSDNARIADPSAYSTNLPPVLGIAFSTGDFAIINIEDQTLLGGSPWSTGKIFESTENMGEIKDIFWKWGTANGWRQEYCF